MIYIHKQLDRRRLQSKGHKYRVAKCTFFREKNVYLAINLTLRLYKFEINWYFVGEKCLKFYTIKLD